MKELTEKLAVEAKAMTRQVIVRKAINKELTTEQGAQLLQISKRQMRRLKAAYRKQGPEGLTDRRGRGSRKKRIGFPIVQTICRLKAEKYPDYSVQHFYEQLTEKHDVDVSYSTVLRTLQRQGLVEKTERRGKYRRRRQRQPMIGMRLHLDSSTHAWLGPDKPMWDLTVMLDDADGRILSARFDPEEGTRTTLQALWDVLTTHGRFCELYTDCGSHFCQIADKDQGPAAVQHTEVARVLQALHIRHIWGRSPQARGRSERAFGTIQGRLPQELRQAGITDYEAANRYLQEVFVPDFNRRFTVEPAQTGSAFSALPNVNLPLLLSIHTDRTLNLDFTVRFKNRLLQLPPCDIQPRRRRPVTVHNFLDGTLGVSYRGQLLATFDADGNPLVMQKRLSPTEPKVTRMMPTAAPPPRRPRYCDMTDPNFWAFLTDHVGHRPDVFIPW